MPSELSKHVIGARNGPVPLLEWVKGHQYRNYFLFSTEEQLDYAKKAAALNSKAARDLVLSLLTRVTHLQEAGEEMHKEFDTLHNALTKIESNTP